ncbi:MAG: serine/threonine protein kinase [Polyangiaceae bacterium]|nr:serine/threonine protein kinase [Polyangiaceae bacterium]
MGAVYEAEHLQIGRLVAVKVLHPRESQKHEAVSRLEHEARVAGRIGHPNICEVYDIGRLPDGSPYLVMERLHGETLAQRITRAGPVPAHEVVDIMLQVLSALVTAHERGIIHRDLKPENIFLSQRAGMLPVAKLLDFGISKSSGVGDAALNLTQPGMVMGTPYYMAPEQARGDRRLDHRVDLWAVGVILYEALTGQRPFVAKNYNALLVQILTAQHRPAAERYPAVPAKLSRLVDRALAKEREQRFQSAGDFLEALRRFKRRAATPTPPPRRAPTNVRVHTIDEEASDDGTMMFARVQDFRGRGAGEPLVVPAGPRAGAGAARPRSELPPSSRAGGRGAGEDPTTAQQGPPAPPAGAPAAPRQPGEEDDATVIDQPTFLEDSITMVRRDPRPRGDRG